MFLCTMEWRSVRGGAIGCSRSNGQALRGLETKGGWCMQRVSGDQSLWQQERGVGCYLLSKHTMQILSRVLFFPLVSWSYRLAVGQDKRQRFFLHKKNRSPGQWNQSHPSQSCLFFKSFLSFHPANKPIKDNKRPSLGWFKKNSQILLDISDTIW